MTASGFLVTLGAAVIRPVAVYFCVAVEIPRHSLTGSVHPIKPAILWTEVRGQANVLCKLMTDLIVNVPHYFLSIGFVRFTGSGQKFFPCWIRSIEAQGMPVLVAWSNSHTF